MLKVFNFDSCNGARHCIIILGAAKKACTQQIYFNCWTSLLDHVGNLHCRTGAPGTPSQDLKIGCCVKRGCSDPAETAAADHQNDASEIPCGIVELWELYQADCNARNVELVVTSLHTMLPLRSTLIKSKNL